MSIIRSEQIEQPVNLSGSFTGSLLGTASWADNAISASYATTSSYAFFAQTASSAQNASDIILLTINQSGAQINKGTVVRITGSNNSSDTPRIGVADWTNDNLSANTLGLAMSNIADGDSGYVMTEGIFLGYDTSTPGWITGQVVYLGANGSITGSAPIAPLHSVRLGQVLRTQQNNGSIYIRIDNGYELDELHDIKITNVTSGDLLIRSGSVWINSKILTGSYTLSGSLTTDDGVKVQTLTASFISASGGITGSLFGTAATASYVLNAVSASFATTASYLLNAPPTTISRSFGITIDGGGVAITSGVKGDVVIPFNMTISSWTLLADQAGSIVIDVWKDIYANFPPTAADSIAGSEKPTLTIATKNQDTNLATWTTSVSAGDIVRFNVDSASTLSRVTLTINGTS